MALSLWLLYVSLLSFKRQDLQLRGGLWQAHGTREPPETSLWILGRPRFRAGQAVQAHTDSVAGQDGRSCRVRAAKAGDLAPWNGGSRAEPGHRRQRPVPAATRCPTTQASFRLGVCRGAPVLCPRCYVLVFLPVASLTLPPFPGASRSAHSGPGGTPAGCGLTIHLSTGQAGGSAPAPGHLAAGERKAQGGPRGLLPPSSADRGSCVLEPAGFQVPWSLSGSFSGWPLPLLSPTELRYLDTRTRPLPLNRPPLTATLQRTFHNWPSVPTCLTWDREASALLLPGPWNAGKCSPQVEAVILGSRDTAPSGLATTPAHDCSPAGGWWTLCAR